MDFTPLSDEQRDSLIFIKQSANSLMNVVDQMLDLSNLESKKIWCGH